MKVAVFVKATTSSEAGIMPSEQLLTAMGRYCEDLIKAGVMLDGEGLKPSSKSVRVRFSGSDRVVINGPFAETKELVAGYWLWEVTSMDEAIAWVKKCPNPMPEESEIEIRPFVTSEDFGAALTPALREQDERYQVAAAMRQASVQTYLFFGGRCEEALTFYQSAIFARVGTIMRWSECPEPPPPAFAHKIMHCEFTVGGVTLMASDGCWTDERKPHFEGFRMTITVATVAVADQVFNALAVGGRIDMPQTETFWSPRYGMVTDQFGVGWMVMVQSKSN